MLVLSLVLLALVFGAAAVAAQEAETIPAYGEAFLSRLSSDGHLLATFENSVYHEDVIVPQLLPIRVYDLEQGEVVRSFIGQQDYARDVAFSPDNRLLAAYYATGWLYVWQVETGELVQRHPVAPGGSLIQWLPGTPLVALGVSVPAQVQLWDTDTGYMTSLLTERAETIEAYRATQTSAPPDGIAAMRVSPDGAHIAVTTFYGRVLNWDVTTGAATLLYNAGLERAQMPMRALAYDADGARLYTLDRMTKSLLVLDTATGELLAQIAADNDSQRPLAVSADGRHAAWLTGKGTTLEAIQIADIASGEVTEIAPPLPDGTRVFIVLSELYFDDSADRLIMTGAAGSPEGAAPYENAIYFIPLPD